MKKKQGRCPNFTNVRGHRTLAYSIHDIRQANIHALVLKPLFLENPTRD